MSKDEKLGTCWLNEVGHGGLHEKSDRCSEWREQPAPGEHGGRRAWLEHEAEVNREPAPGEPSRCDVEIQLSKGTIYRCVLPARHVGGHSSEPASPPAPAAPICGICNSVHDAKLVYDHRWMSVEMAQCLRAKFEPSAPAGGAREFVKMRDKQALDAGYSRSQIRTQEWVAMLCEQFSAQLRQERDALKAKLEGQ